MSTPNTSAGTAARTCVPNMATTQRIVAAAAITLQTPRNAIAAAKQKGAEQVTQKARGCRDENDPISASLSSMTL